MVCVLHWRRQISLWHCGLIYCWKSWLLVLRHFKRIQTLSGEVSLLKLFCLPSGKGSTLKGTNLLPQGANSFLLEFISFQRETGMQQSKQEVTKKLCPFAEMAITHQVYSVSLKCYLQPSGHTTLKQRRFNVDPTYWRWINVESTFLHKIIWT